MKRVRTPTVKRASEEPKPKRSQEEPTEQRAPAAPRPKRAAKRAPKVEGVGATARDDAARDLAVALAAAGLEKKAAGVEILDVVGKVDYADFLVLMTGTSSRHVDALAQELEHAARERGSRALSVEGLPAATWVLLDFGDVVAHVFQEEARGLYDIDGLWMDAARLRVPKGQA